jgi:signal transduction histidine kinase
MDRVVRTVRTSPAWSARLPVLYGGLGLVLVLVFLTVPSELGRAVFYDALAASAVLAILAGVRIHRPAKPLPWFLLAAGFGAFVAGEIAWHVYGFALEQDPFPSLADLFYLAGYPLIGAGLLLLARDLGAGRAQERAGALDAAIVTVGAFVVSWVLLVDPYAADGSLPLIDRALSAAYPLMDVLLLTLLVRLLFVPGRRTPAVVLIAAALAFNIAADVAFGVLELHGGSPGKWLDAIWLLGYLCVGTAALHPSMASPPAPGRRREGLTLWRLGALAMAAVTAPTVLALEAFSGEIDGIVVIAIGAALLSLLVLLRLVGLVRELERAGRERQRLYESERAALEEAEAAQRLLVEQNDRLRELDRLKDEFVALVSHELRTPLTSITGYLELVLDDPALADEHRRFLDVVDRNAARLLRLVSDLLLVAQIESGKLVLDPCEVDLAAVAAESVEALRPVADGGGVDLRLDATDVPPLRGDRARLAQLFDNLVSNAVKFTEPGGHVVVALECSGDDVTVVVSDDGIGIAPADQRRLFDRFFRAAGAQQRAIGGSGLGLTIARAIVDAHGGAMELESREGEGTTFRVRLPLVAPPGTGTGSLDREAQGVI